MKQQNNQSERGNVLFLILIAVALFAALSYVVTQSTRSGGGSTEREKNILSSAQMTQYPTALRTAIIRMILGGVGVESLRFNAPGAFGSISSQQLVFHPQGGGAVFQEAPAELMANAGQGTWTYNANFDILGIGMDGVGGNDLVAFLPNVTQGVCRQTNEELGVTEFTGCTLNGGVPPIDAAVTTTLINETMDDTYTFPTGDEPNLEADGCTAFERQASGCFYDGTRYVFYSVLLER